MEYNFDVGKRIKEIREQLNISQKELYKLLNISQSKLSKLENNKLSYDTLHFIIQFCEIANITPNEFFNYNDENKYRSLIEKVKGLNDHQIEKLTDFIESMIKN